MARAKKKPEPKPETKVDIYIKKQAEGQTEEMANAIPASGNKGTVNPESTPVKQGVNPGPKEVKLKNGAVRKDN